jgi:hypothetical protein
VASLAVPFSVQATVPQPDSRWRGVSGGRWPTALAAGDNEGMARRSWSAATQLR